MFEIFLEEAMETTTQPAENGEQPAPSTAESMEDVSASIHSLKQNIELGSFRVRQRRRPMAMQRDNKMKR